MNIRIMLADDHEMFREGLRVLIEQQADMEVVGEASDGRTAVQLAEELAPDVVVVDIGMPDLNGIEATRRILEKNANIRVVALSIHSEREFVASMLEAGALGYLFKENLFQELVTAIRTVIKNQTYLCSKIDRFEIDELRRKHRASIAHGASALTPREREVLQLLAEGKSTKETASMLFITDKTVETHRLNIREKLGLHTIAELTRYAVRAGLVTM